MKKVYVIEEIINTDNKIVGYNLEYQLVGFFANKAKAEEFIKNGTPIEMYNTKRFINKYRMTELNSL